MFDRNWRFGAAFGIILGISLLANYFAWMNLNYRPVGDDYRYSDENAGPKNSEGQISQPSRTDGIEDSHPADVYGHKDYYTHQDLQAQDSMAKSTESIVFLTKVSMVLGAFGTLLVLLTLRETRNAVNVSQEVGRDENRAYVTVSEIFGLRDKSGAFLQFWVKNGGHTPCIRFEIGLVCQVVHHNEIPPQPQDEDLTFKGWSGLSGNDVFTAKVIPKISLLNIVKKYPDTDILWIAGTIKYRTFFGEDFRSEFSFYTWETFRDGGLGSATKEIKFSRTTKDINVCQKV